MRNSSGFPDKSTVDRIRARYPTGCRVELISMDDSHTKLLPGEKGTVSIIDSTGTVFVNWDCGSSLGVVYGVDRIRRLSPFEEAWEAPERLR